ncbi:hypothetical protein D3C87_2122000 [compost metagenome]
MTGGYFIRNRKRQLQCWANGQRLGQSGEAVAEAAGSVKAGVREQRRFEHQRSQGTAAGAADQAD